VGKETSQLQARQVNHLRVKLREGYVSRNTGARVIRLLVLPIVLCIAFYAIADIDSPRRGIILVHPQNLISLAQSLQEH
jgi:hypothetical protein